MKLDKYKKYRKYTLFLIPLVLLIYSFSEQKHDISYSIAITLLFIIMIIGPWIEILIKKELEEPITNKDRFFVLFPLIISLFLLPSLWTKLI